MVAALLTLIAPAVGAQWSYEGALSGTTGRYIFTERTTSLNFANGVSFRAGRLTLRTTVPFGYQNTTLITTSGAGIIPTGGPSGQGIVRDSGEARRRGQTDGGGPHGNGPGGQGPQSSGTLSFAEDAIPAPGEAITGYQLRLGDPMASGTLRLIERKRVSVALSGTVKVPVADTATVSTGKWDLGGHAALSIRLDDRWTFGADAGYWHLGDLDSLDLVDPVIGAVSVGRLFGDRWGAVVGLSAASSTLTGFDPSVSLTGGLSRLGSPGSWGISAAVGLTETAADISVGTFWWFRL